MSEFVDECRREWSRLGVPDAVANEMAADLKADLDEAEADGVAAEAVLGSSAFDPRSFAASWAAERGVVGPPAQPPAVQGNRSPVRPLVLAAFALLVLIGAALVLSVRRTVEVRQAVGLPFRGARLVLPARPVAPVGPEGLRLRSVPSALGYAVNVTGPDGGYLRGIGLILLVLGLAGLAVAILSWSRPAGLRGWLGRRGL